MTSERLVDDSPVVALTREGARVVATHSDLKGSDWRVLFYALGQIGGSNVINPFSIADASEELHLTRPTIYAALKRLRQAGIFYQEPQPGEEERTLGIDHLNENVGLSAFRVMVDDPYSDVW